MKVGTLGRKNSLCRGTRSELFFEKDVLKNFWYTLFYFLFSSKDVFALFHVRLILLEVQLFLVWNFSDTIKDSATDIWSKHVLRQGYTVKYFFQSDRSASVNIFSEHLSNGKFQHYLWMNSTSSYWSYIDFYTLTFLYFLHLYYTACIDYFVIYWVLQFTTEHVFHFYK